MRNKFATFSGGLTIVNRVEHPLLEILFSCPTEISPKSIVTSALAQN